MRKYELLAEYLHDRPESELVLPLSYIEDLVDGGLPTEALHSPAWWANDVESGDQSAAWLDCGLEVVQVDLSAAEVHFVRVDAGTY